MRKNKYKNITLIGMPGVGKSVLGRKLAKRLGCKFLDIDEVIKKQIGLDPQEIIDKFGEKRVLEIEEEIVLNLGYINNYIISPGGSIVYSKKAMLFLKKISKIIFLHASFRSIKRRLLNISTRGIIGLKEKNLKELYKERNPLYKKYADIVVEVPDNLDVTNLFKKLTQ